MRRHRTARQRGFSFIELMTVVAIVGVISAIAIPIFTSYVRRSKRSEGKLQVEHMIRKISLYHTINKELPESANVFPTLQACAQSDGLVPPQAQSAWNLAGWEPLEFHIDESTRFRYSWTKTDDTTGVATAVGDMDCDGQSDVFVVEVGVVEGNVLETVSQVLDDD